VEVQAVRSGGRRGDPGPGLIRAPSGWKPAAEERRPWRGGRADADDHELVRATRKSYHVRIRFELEPLRGIALATEEAGRPSGGGDEPRGRRGSPRPEPDEAPLDDAQPARTRAPRAKLPDSRLRDPIVRRLAQASYPAGERVLEHNAMMMASALA